MCIHTDVHIHPCACMAGFHAFTETNNSRSFPHGTFHPQVASVLDEFMAKRSEGVLGGLRDLLEMHGGSREVPQVRGGVTWGSAPLINVP